jgi:Acyl-CoA dehydrogenase, C-terminal domain
VEFTFTDEQELLRREARQALDGGAAPDFESLGWTPEGLREAGLGFVDEAVLHEEVGRAGQGAAFFEAVVASRSREEQLAALALEAVGVAQKALELAVEHASNREQFGRRIAVYQAVSHRLADTYVETELARSLAYWAAWCVSEEDELAPIAAMAAKSFAGDAAVAACERSIQVHGGIGFTWEHVLHGYYERALAIQAFGGYSRTLRAQVAAWLLDE